MKKLFSHEEFRSHISQLLEEPFYNFANKINRELGKGHRPSDRFQREAEVQTTYLKEIEAVKHFERQLESMTVEVSALRASKNKMENNLIENLTTFHKYEMKSMELSSKNKQLQAELNRLESELIMTR